MKITIKAYAKINLLLDICSKRTDGAHDLCMIMQSVGLYDTVSVERKGRSIVISSNIDDIPLDDKNIAHKAAIAFFKSNKIRSRGIHIHLEKRIPHQAGLAGGSADGAAVLVALNELYKTGLNDDELCEIGIKIGADVPFCIKGGTLLAQGKGEILSAVKPLRKCSIVLAKPDYGVNTGEAFRAFDEIGKHHSPDSLGMLKAVYYRDLYDVASKMENVFEQFIEVPDRIYIKEIMRNNNALGVCMSGSGPTIFGIFDSKEDAASAAKELKEYAKDVFVTAPVSKGCKIVNITE